MIPAVVSNGMVRDPIASSRTERSVPSSEDHGPSATSNEDEQGVQESYMGSERRSKEVSRSLDTRCG